MHRGRVYRLPSVSYIGFRRYFLTICTAGRLRALVDHALVRSHLPQLRRSASLHEVEIPAYCFMPDLHLLVHGASASADLPAFVAHYKQATGFAYRRLTGASLWQVGYYDRVREGRIEIRTYDRHRA